MTAYMVQEVFTPTSPAKINFVPREAANDQLVDALRTPGMQVIVYGETGSGKSTLLQRKLDELYPAHITTRCSASSTFEQVLLDAFDRLDRYFIDTATVGTAGSLSGGLAAELKAVRVDIQAMRKNEASETTRRLLPPQLTPQRLGEFIGEAGLCWVLEDFHKVPEAEKTPIAQSLKIFSDLGNEYPDARIIAIGATDTAREVVQYEPEMQRRVSEILVPLMDENELGAILANGLALMNVDFSRVSEAIVKYSTGVASVTHQLALSICREKGIEATAESRVVLQDDDLASALESWVRDSSDTLKATFDRALLRKRVRKYDNCRLILATLAAGPLVGLTHAQILTSIRDTESDYPASNLTQYLRELQTDERGSVLRFGVDGRFRFLDPLLHTYAQVTLLPARKASARDLESLLYTTLVTQWRSVSNVGTIAWANPASPIFVYGSTPFPLTVQYPAGLPAADDDHEEEVPHDDSGA